jgi:hypothetical protein
VWLEAAYVRERLITGPDNYRRNGPSIRSGLLGLEPSRTPERYIGRHGFEPCVTAVHHHTQAHSTSATAAMRPASAASLSLVDAAAAASPTASAGVHVHGPRSTVAQLATTMSSMLGCVGVGPPEPRRPASLSSSLHTLIQQLASNIERERAVDQ